MPGPEWAGDVSAIPKDAQRIGQSFIFTVGSAGGAWLGWHFVVGAALVVVALFVVAIGVRWANG